MTPQPLSAPALARLADPDPAVRAAAAKWLYGQACAEINRDSAPWLRDPATAAALLPLLADPGGPAAPWAVAAAAVIARRFNPDPRLLAPAVPILASRDAFARGHAAELVARLGESAGGDLVVARIADRAWRVRSVALTAAAHACAGWPADLRGRARLAALGRLGDRVRDVRCEAANLLALIGAAEDLPALRRCAAATEGANYRQSLRESARELKGRLAGGQ